nr:phosphate-starvation-inducible PsiE family protein [uncultured Peptostreptococcus sp.]
MKTVDNKKKHILKIAYGFESILAIVILIAVLLGIIDILRIIYDSFIIHFNRPIDYGQLNAIFAQILLLVIGIELAVMLTLHIQTALIEVLLFGIARKMLLLPKNNGMVEILLGVIAIAGLFLIRKYLIKEDSTLPEDIQNSNAKQN